MVNINNNSCRQSMKLGGTYFLQWRGETIDMVGGKCVFFNSLHTRSRGLFRDVVHQRGDNVMYLYTVRTSERRQCVVSIYRPYIIEETMCCIYIPSVHQRGDNVMYLYTSVHQRGDNVLYLYTVRTSEWRQCDVSIYRPYIREETMWCIYIPSVHQRGDNVMYLYTVRTSERRQCVVSICRPYIREETMWCIYIRPYIREETMCCIYTPSVHQRGDNVLYLYTVRTS